MRIIFLSYIFIFFSQLTIYGQNSNFGSTTTIYDITSKEEKDYKLKITVPPNYDQNKNYKVLYYLDAWWLSELVLGSYAILSLSENIDEIVLVGITIDGNVLDWNRQRTIDFTPSIYDMPIAQTAGVGEAAIKLDASTTGGAAIFMEFLESTVLKFMDDKFPNLKKNRGLLGHSFGGLFGFYIMQKKPELFTDYVLISPSLWWNKPELLRPELFNDFAMQKRPRKLYLSYGEEESKWIVQSSITMNEIINNLAQSQFDYKFVAYDKANHNSILTRAIYDGLLFLYKK